MRQQTHNLKKGAALQPIQLGVGVPGEAEAAIHATRRYVQQLNYNNVLVKLDFNNALNSIRRDLVLDSTADKTSELYRLFTHHHRAIKY